MIGRRATRTLLTAALALCALAALLPAVTSAAAAPVWRFTATSQPTHFAPGSSNGVYLLVATNVGAGATTAPITVKDTLPAGLVPKKPFAYSNDLGVDKFDCPDPVGQSITCTGATAIDPVHPGFSVVVEIPVQVAALPDPSVRINEAEIEGGGALPKTAGTTTTISNSLPVFDFLERGTPFFEAGFSAPSIQEDGTPATEAGGHPYEAIVDLSFPTEEPGGLLTGAGHLRDTIVDFPRGVLANPLATATRCTEVELVSQDFPGCPASSQVGTVTINTAITEVAVGPKTSPLYNMVPPPGAPAAFGLDAVGAGIFVHVIASLRTEEDFGASGSTNDILALGLNPILDARVELWGDPTSEVHDFIRGNCVVGAPPPCDVVPKDIAFLTSPGDCPGVPLSYAAHADSWEETGDFRHAEYEGADLGGNPVKTEDCGSLEFKPEIKAQPTTNLIDSPSGLNFTLHQPQSLNLDQRYTATVKDTTVTLPEGLSVNASLADGLAACTSAEIGLISSAPVRFKDEPARCPEAAKIGKLSASSPLLDHSVEGSVYVAKPFDNPFNTLTAIYLVIEDPKSGIIAKFAGEVIPNPTTGQLKTRVTEAPELPLEDLEVNLFTGARAPLQTPPVCTTHTIAADLLPWSAPEGKGLQLADSFLPTATPSPGACPSVASQAPNAPAFEAGTLAPTAGAFSPLVLKLAREDGSQRLAQVETTLAPGLSARLAGIPYCSEEQLAAASARSQPNQGALERANPSCPGASEVGVATVGAGAGPNPIYVQGRAYLAPPYKGAPLSIAIITPAIAGPFDLGTVVVRTAIYLNPTTAQGRAVSDPFPTILHGIPVNVRSVAVKADRPSFTINPTSCDPMTITGTATSTLGLAAPLSSPFEVGGCESLPFKPKLTTRLFGPTRRGGHPRFRAVLTAKPGSANIASSVVALPHSEFLDQAHIRTICTRVQYAADQCPAGSVYGHAKATSPLVDYPVEGPIYLRSSNNELPDVVAALRGPPHQPIEIDLVGRVDSVNGGIRTSFEAVPDAPVTKAIITMQGGKKGLLQNSTNICRGIHRTTVKMDGQNGKVYDSRPMLKADCPKKKKRGGKGR